MVKIQLKKLPPSEIITRTLLLADLQTVPPELVKEVEPGLVIEVAYKDGKGEIKRELGLDWEKIFFETNTIRLDFIMGHFNRKTNPEEAKKKEEEAKAFIHTLASNLKPTETPKIII